MRRFLSQKFRNDATARPKLKTNLRLTPQAIKTNTAQANNKKRLLLFMTKKSSKKEIKKYF